MARRVCLSPGEREKKGGKQPGLLEDKKESPRKGANAHNPITKSRIPEESGVSGKAQGRKREFPFGATSFRGKSKKPKKKHKKKKKKKKGSRAYENKRGGGDNPHSLSTERRRNQQPGEREPVGEGCHLPKDL